MILGKQSRAARAILGWSIDELAERSAVDRGVIHRFENDSSNIRKSSLDSIYGAFIKADIKFIGRTGVSEKESMVDIFRGEDCIQMVWDNILQTFDDGKGGEVLIMNVDERKTLQNKSLDLMAYLEKLKKLNITERLLTCEGDNFFLAPKDSYRWVPSDTFSFGLTTIIYKSKVSYVLFGSDMLLLVHSKEAYEAEKKRFEYIWQNAIIPK